MFGKPSDKPKPAVAVPTARDFTPQAVKKALLKYTLEHPLTTYPAALFMLSILASALFGLSGLSFAALVGTFGISCLSGVWNYFFCAEKFEHRRSQKLQEIISKYAEQKRKELEQDLLNYDCQQGCEQLERLQAKFQVFQELLAAKLNTGELTYQRYLATVQEVFLSALDNLTYIVATLKSISTIKEDYINQRIQELQRKQKSQLGNGKQAAQIEILEKELALRQQELEKVDGWLLENEDAMLQLDIAVNGIKDMDTGQDQGKIDMQTSMEALLELTQRASQYSKKQTNINSQGGILNG